MSKWEYVDEYIAPALVAMDIGIVNAEYIGDNNVEIVIVTFEDGDKRIANVAMDSLLGIWKDITKQILADL